MALTDAVVRNSKPQAKPYTLKDIQGLSLYISPTSNKAWHYRYTLEGKRNRVSLGQYPYICLKEARQKCEDARFLVKSDMPLPKVLLKPNQPLIWTFWPYPKDQPSIIPTSS